MRKILFISLLFVCALSFGQGIMGGTVASSGGAAPYTPVTMEVTRYIDGLTTPLSDLWVAQLDTFVTYQLDSLGIDSLAEEFDFQLVLANETEEAALRDLVKGVDNATNVGSTEFIQYEGFWGDGASNYINTGYTPSADAVNFSQDDASIAVFTRTTTPQSLALDLGAEGGPGRAYIYGRQGNQANISLNTGSSPSSYSNRDGRGMWMGVRNSSSSQVLYQDNVARVSGTETSTGLTTNSLFVGARNSGSAARWANREHSWAAAGEAWDSAQRSNIGEALDYLLDARNKNITRDTIYTSPTLSAQQGYAWDGTYHYAIDDPNHYLYKKNDDAWWSNAVDSVDAFAGTSLDKGGDGDWYNGNLYLVGHTTGEPRTNESILVFDASDLSRDSIHDISDHVNGNLGGLTVDPDDGDNGIVYITIHDDSDSIYQFDLLDFSYLGGLELPYALDGTQGITTRGDWFYLSAHSGSIETVYKVSKDMQYHTIISHCNPCGEHEGIDYSDDELRIQSLDGSFDSNVYYIELQE